MSSLQSGDEVVTNGGIYGKLSLIEETFVNLKSLIIQKFDY